MAATFKRNMWLYRDDGSPAVIEEGRIAASQGIFIGGTPCYMTTAGTLKAVATAAASASAFHGVLLQTQTAELAVNTMVRWMRFKAGQIWAAYCDSSGTDSAVGVTNVGEIHQLTVDAATSGQIGYATVNLGSNNTQVQIVGLMADKEPSKYAVADNPGVCLFKVLQANIDADDS